MEAKTEETEEEGEEKYEEYEVEIVQPYGLKFTKGIVALTLMPLHREVQLI
jgi:hypothetical protein